MSEVVKKFGPLVAKIERERGPFSLFGVFLREDVPDRWDVVISAPWATRNKQEAVNYLIDEIKSHLGPQGLINVSRIVVADPNDSSVKALTRALQIEQGPVELRDTNIFGLLVRHAFILVSRPLENPVPT